MKVRRYVSKIDVSETFALANHNLNTGPWVSAVSIATTYAYSIHLVERLSTFMTLGIVNKSTHTLNLCLQVLDTPQNTIDMLRRMDSSPDDRDELIKELFTEAQGLRMKNERISQYTESKIAELVKTRRELLQVRGGIEEVVEQRNALQGQLSAITSEYDQLLAMQVVMADQRDRLRTRIAEIEASRSYRIGQRLSRFAAKFSSSS